MMMFQEIQPYRTLQKLKLAQLERAIKAGNVGLASTVWDDIKSYTLILQNAPTFTISESRDGANYVFRVGPMSDDMKDEGIDEIKRAVFARGCNVIPYINAAKHWVEISVPTSDLGYIQTRLEGLGLVRK